MQRVHRTVQDSKTFKSNQAVPTTTQKYFKLSTITKFFESYQDIAKHSNLANQRPAPSLPPYFLPSAHNDEPTIFPTIIPSWWWLVQLTALQVHCTVEVERLAVLHTSVTYHISNTVRNSPRQPHITNMFLACHRVQLTPSGVDEPSGHKTLRWNQPKVIYAHFTQQH